MDIKMVEWQISILKEGKNLEELQQKENILLKLKKKKVIENILKKI